MSALLTPLPSPAPALGTRITPVPTWSPLPVSNAYETPGSASPAALPAWPTFPPVATAPVSASEKVPLTVVPLPIREVLPWESPFAKGLDPSSAPRVTSAKPLAAAEPDYTDDDLREAFGPIVQQAVLDAVNAKDGGFDFNLEPMLRSTIRRSLAEHSPFRPFREPRIFDRLVWLVQGLFSSRTYQDILFEKTQRFQVEEVFLMDASTLALISFASCDPARHSSAIRVTSTAQRVALQLRDAEGKVRESFDLPDKRKAVSRAGRFVTLTAIVRGTPSELVAIDLEFSLRRIEDHFREKFAEEGSPLMQALQPFLEDCLLIQAPASAA